MLKPELLDWLLNAGLQISAEQTSQLQAFEDALYAANATRNLTRIPGEDFWLRHVIDSLLIQDLFPTGAYVLDIGTGPGFPAWPLAWARPDLIITALDSSGKMLGFLGTQALPNLEIVLARAEESEKRERFDFVTGRAVAPLAAQIELSAAPCKIGGAVIPMRTPSDISLIKSADFSMLGLELESIETRTLPVENVERVFPVYRKVRRTDKSYPRPWSDIRKHPLTLSRSR